MSKISNIASYATKRYILYFVITFGAMIIPWVKIDGVHMFLLSFDHKKFHFLGIAFDMQQLLPMTFILIILFIGVFFITVLLGRAWCGWACPQTIFRVIFRDFIETKLLGLRKSIKNKQKKSINNIIKKLFAVVIWIALSLLISANFIWFFVPPEEFFVYLQNPLDHHVLLGILIILTLFLVYDVIFLQENFCFYICPYSRVQSVLYDDDTIMAIYSNNRGGQIYEDKEKVVFKTKDLKQEDECTTCEKCVTVCPTHIDIRQGLQLECINCLECVDACTTVMGKLNKPSLINWSSWNETDNNKKTNFLRGKILAYLGVILIVLVALVSVTMKKENMILNINRTTQLYNIEKDNSVTNSYIFLVTNSHNKKHKYYFEIVSANNNIEIVRPSKPFRIMPNSKVKKIVILKTNDKLSNSKSDTIIPITVKAFAIDDKIKVKTSKQSIFVYPKQIESK
jgi:cytochrome c oxidase accessory protein FixG